MQIKYSQEPTPSRFTTFQGLSEQRLICEKQSIQNLLPLIQNWTLVILAAHPDSLPSNQENTGGHILPVSASDAPNCVLLIRRIRNQCYCMWNKRVDSVHFYFRCLTTSFYFWRAFYPLKISSGDSWWCMMMYDVYISASDLRICLRRFASLVSLPDLPEPQKLEVKWPKPYWLT